MNEELMRLNLQFFADEGEGPEGGQATEGQGAGQAEPPKDSDKMIPKSRFDEVNSKYKEMLEKIQAYEKTEEQRQKEAEELAKKQAEEQGKFQELYEKTQKELEAYKAYESRTGELESVITSMVETKLSSIDKEYHDLIPANLSPEATLDWLNKAEAKGLFGKKEPKDIGTSKNNKDGKADKIATDRLSPLEKILNGLGK